MVTFASPPPNVLLPHHRKLLDDSGIADSIIKARSYFSATHRPGLARLGFSAFQQNVPALVVPVYDITAAVSGYQILPDRPRTIRGRLVKYENPWGASLTIDVPPAAREKVLNNTDPLFITPTIQKADAAVSHGLTCIGLLGAYAWKNQDEFWRSIPLSRRTIYIVFDSDITTNRSVATAVNALAAHLQSIGARPKVVTIPGDGNKKVGFDDFLKSLRSHRGQSSSGEDTNN